MHVTLQNYIPPTPPKKRFWMNTVHVTSSGIAFSPPTPAPAKYNPKLLLSYIEE